MTLPKVDTLWQHVKTKGIYRVTGLGTIQASVAGKELDEEVAVLYSAVSDPTRIFIRAEREFLDGRFIAINTDPNKSGLKIFHGGDGRNAIVIAAKSLAAAHRALQPYHYVTIGHMRDYWSKSTGNPEQIAAALSKPGTPFWKERDHQGEGYKEMPTIEERRRR